jgi:DNA helicase-2/ATP-dependent DNA helicase PcrA
MTTTLASGTVVGSPQQEAFWDELESGSGHVLLEARAGTGKSFSCREGMKRLRGRSRTYCAFNKHIAEEFQKGLPEGCTASTMHSLGNAACRSAWKGIKLDDRNKTANLLKRHAPWTYDTAQGLAKLVSLCKSDVIDGTDAGQVADLVIRHDIEFGRKDAEKALEKLPLILADAREETGVMDFDDMIWLPVVHELRPRTSDFLFADEAQDFNRCQQRFASLLCPEGRMVVVGDRFQSIYGFRGADTDSIPNMERQLAATGRGLASLPLTVTRRCPGMVVELAKCIVPDIEAMPDAREGVIDTASEERAIRHMEPGDMVLCRTNAPLVGTAFRLIKAGKKAVIKGRDFGASLVKFVKGFQAADIAELSRLVEEYRERETIRLRAAKAKPESFILLDDKCDCIQELASDCRTPADVTARIETLFADESGPAITLSSIHRSKGLEAHHVYILRPDLIPHPLGASGWQATQERNLAYVACTRSMHALTFIDFIPPIFGGW